jgi:CheY-like chemotaxis protein
MTTVLTVDDSLMMRKFIAIALASEGYNVSEAGDGCEAIEIVRNSPPDCVVLDLLMPGVDGIEVLETLRKDNVSIPIIVMTANIQASTEEKCFALGAFRVLNKPPKGDELCAAIRDALASTETA